MDYDPTQFVPFYAFAAEQFGIHKQTAIDWERRGLPTYQVGRVTLVHKQQLTRWMLKRLKKSRTISTTGASHA